MYELLTATTDDWTQTVLNDFDRFLIDHAACERKASSMAMSMLTHYPDRPALVRAMTDLAVEEMLHFKAVMGHIAERNLILTPDEKDPYVNALRKAIRSGRDDYFLDRLLLGSIIEKRGHERFDLMANALPDGKLKTFYANIADSEARHFTLFLTLADQYFEAHIVRERLQKLLVIEANIVDQLPLRAALH